MTSQFLREKVLPIIEEGHKAGGDMAECQRKVGDYLTNGKGNMPKFKDELEATVKP